LENPHICIIFNPDLRLLYLGVRCCGIGLAGGRSLVNQGHARSFGSRHAEISELSGRPGA
jgi:hypothetical protein